MPRTAPAHSVALMASGRGACFNEKEALKLLVDAEKVPDVAAALLRATADYHEGWAAGDETGGHALRAAVLRTAADVLAVILK